MTANDTSTPDPAPVLSEQPWVLGDGFYSVLGLTTMFGEDPREQAEGGSPTCLP